MEQSETASGSSRPEVSGEAKSQPNASNSSYNRPEYMFVGSGAVSENATQLAALIENDSGYGGSITSSQSWDSGLRLDTSEDRPSPGPMSGYLGEGIDSSESNKRAVASHVLQLYYNQNRTALGRAINNVIEMLKKFQDMNQKWPAHYPSIQNEYQAKVQSRNDPRPGLVHTQSTLDNHREQNLSHLKRPSRPKRAGTSLGEEASQAESSTDGSQRIISEPRLVTPQLAQDFSVLKLELKMVGVHQTDLVHSLEKSSIAALLDGQIQQSIRHLHSLKERIDDTSSKVLITGDLNAGKSTFCNALLRRKVLPEDQQPCTSIFCEVLDCGENAGIEEVHAIPNGIVYNRHDESSYESFPLSSLDRIVTNNEKYSQCKVYVKDIRSVDESLLNNGVVDIALIDAPGLNFDSLKTTALFARQEEIDVVVFVVSAANHFTQSAKEFIFNAAREKAYMFMVVNGFDNIRDKNRCQEAILKQVAHLSPATFKESADLVHFVSSTAIPVSSSNSGPSHPGPGSGSSSGSPGFDDSDEFGEDDNSDGEGPNGKHSQSSPISKKGKGKEREKLRDFEALETSLRRFVLEKRARSKLAPAKTYLTNLLTDLHNIALVNRDIAQSEFERVKQELDSLEPAFEKSKKSRSEAGETLDEVVESVITSSYNFSKEMICSSISRVASDELGVVYPGVMAVFRYAEDVKEAMLREIASTIQQCEEHARIQAVSGFNSIKSLGVLHIGNDYPEIFFLSDKMFRRPRHTLARYVEVDVEIWDFFDVASLWEQQEKLAGTSMAVTVAGVVGGRMIGGLGWVDGILGAARVLGANNLRRLIVPGLLVSAILGVSYALKSIPRALPKRLGGKISYQLAQQDYVHANAMRISSELRRALKGPGNDLRVELQRNVEKLQSRKEDVTKMRTETDVARKYFSNLVRNSSDVRRSVAAVDLERSPPNPANSFSS